MSHKLVITQFESLKLQVAHKYVHTLCVCVGGGSALLPAPVPPISLQDKQDVTRRLAGAGATIQELNSVRRALSILKGGGLAHCAHPAQVRAQLY